MNKRKTSQGFANVSLKILKYVIMVIVLVVCATAAFNFGTDIFDEEGVEPAPGTDMTVTVTEGTSIKDLGKMLEEYGIIKDASIFRVQAYIYNGKNIKPGTYTFNTSQGGEDIFSIIKSGPKDNKNPEESETEEK